MKHETNNPPTNAKDALEQATAALRGEQPDSAAMSTASERVWQRLSQEVAAAANVHVESIRGCEDVRNLLIQYRGGTHPSARALLVEAHLHDCVGCRRELENRRHERSVPAPWKQELPQVGHTGFRWVAAAAAVVVFGIVGYFAQAWYFSGPAGMRARVESL